ncbi:MAG: prolyl oligopeptidase family serine peptidase [Candidatus Hydrogenedentes bacterium]|nr:prolyl oligopeptidase family serine peptidase [Candidatus Hydrogenedentota bacterium]
MKRLLQALGLKKREKVAPNALQHTIHIRSTLDGHRQPCLFIAATPDEPRPLLVYLHPWRHGYDFDSTPWQQEARKRNWHFLAPHFRGPNKRPQACASKLARQDVLDAVNHICLTHAVDERRIYVCGVSGGGHMALIMAAEAPERWAAVSAWCPITDLAEFHRECIALHAKTYRHVEKVAGGPPGSSPRVDAEIAYRSPVHHLAKAQNLPVDINHGIDDGQPKGVGIQHSVWAFNALADALDVAPLPSDVLENLVKGRVAVTASQSDPAYERPIFYRQTAGPSRITIFDGGHEDLPASACAWLEQHARA